MPTPVRDALERLRAAAADGRLRQLAADHGLRLVVAFGSAVRDEAPPRDLDLAVEPSGGVDLLRLHADLSSLADTEDLDVLDLSRAGIVARAEALGGGEPLHEAEPGRFAEAQVTALAQLWDTRWLRDVELRTLAR